MKHYTFLLILICSQAACVSSGTYEKLANEKMQVGAELDKTKAELTQIKGDLRTLQEKNKQVRGHLNRSEQKQSQLWEQNENLQKSLKTSEINNLRREKELEEVKEQKDQIRQKAQSYLNVISKFQNMVDAGKLSVDLKDGRMVVELPSDILFASGRTNLSSEGTGALGELANILQDMPGYRFQVEGHTDNVPIARRGNYSNWNLAAERAISVVDFLIKSGVAPTSLSAASFGEFKPKSPNDTKIGRAQNRRIEIVVLPNLSAIANDLPRAAH